MIVETAISRKLADGTEEDEFTVKENPIVSVNLAPAPKIIEVKGWTTKRATVYKEQTGEVLPRFMLHQYYPKGIDVAITGKQIMGGVGLGLLTTLVILGLAGSGTRTMFPAPGILGAKPSKAAEFRGGRKTALEEAMEQLILGSLSARE